MSHSHSSPALTLTPQVALVVKILPANAGDVRRAGLILGSERRPGGEHDNPFQYSCLENPMDREAGQATVHGVTKSWAWLKWLSRQDLDSPTNSYNLPSFSPLSPNPATPNLPHSALWFHLSCYFPHYKYIVFLFTLSPAFIVFLKLHEDKDLCSST